MSEIKNNEVEQNKSPEPSPRTVSEGDSAKLKPADGTEGSMDYGKGKDSSGRDSSKGEHPKLSPENDGNIQGKGEKPETTRNDNPHEKFSSGEADAEKEKQPVTVDPNATKSGDGNSEKEKQPVSDDLNAKKSSDGNSEKEKQPVTDDPNAKKSGDENSEKEKQPVSDDSNAKKTYGVTPTPETDGQADGANKTDGIKKDGVTSTSNVEMKDAAPKKEGFFDRISHFFNHSKDSAEKPTQPEAEKRGNWDGMETAPAPNGSGWTLLPGNHFDKYSDIDRNYADHPRTAYPKEQQEFRTVNPTDIEGVYLGNSDIEDPSRFWGMHNGSREAWMDTASHIPEVQARLESGEPLESLLQDEQLGKCAQAYFNPDSSKAIQVDEMAGGGYMFNGDGRHRIIAARVNGYDIPVRVVGIRQ